MVYWIFLSMSLADNTSMHTLVLVPKKNYIYILSQNSVEHKFLTSFLNFEPKGVEWLEFLTDFLV